MDVEQHIEPDPSSLLLIADRIGRGGNNIDQPALDLVEGADHRYQAVRNSADRLELILNRIVNVQGPFWDDQRQINGNPHADRPGPGKGREPNPRESHEIDRHPSEENTERDDCK